MKKIFVFLISLLFLVSCGVSNRITRNDDIEFAVGMYAETYVYSSAQVDSMCIADTLPEIKYWRMDEYTDFTTSNVICKYLYIKGEKCKEVVYVLSGCEEPYNLSKRVKK